MQEIKTKGSDAEAVASQSQQDLVATKSKTPQRSRESLWGAVLFACMLLFVIVSVSGIGWVIYSQWKSERLADSQPSISALREPASGEQAVPAEIDSALASESETATPETADATAAAQKLTISVLNGGGAKGSAGTLADVLKKEGYTKVSPGNTIKDYTGVTVYYTANLEKEAASIKGSVAKQYPQATLSAADAKNKETSVSQITVIIGK